MNRALMWWRMLGTAGAVANARRLLDEREREAWIVDALEARVLARSTADPEVTAA